LQIEEIKMSLVEGPPDPLYPKLPFWNVVSLSYSTYFRHFIDVLRASWLWLVVVTVFTGFASWYQLSWMAVTMANLKPGLPPQMSKPGEMALLMSLTNILILLAGVSIAVAWHRLIILNEPPGLSGSNVATRNLWRYIGVAIAVFLIDFLPAAVVMFPAFYFVFPLKAGGNPPPSGPFAVIPLILVLYAIGTAVAFRLSLLLPARAVGDLSLTFKQTWRRTRGNTWRLYWGIVVTTMPPLLLPQIGFLTMIGAPSPANFASEDFVAQMTAASAVFTVYYLLIVPIGIGFLSHAYRHFFQAPIELAE
jgi:hypothetical protein